MGDVDRDSGLDHRCRNNGDAIARELSKYKVDTILLESREDVGMGETKASHGFIYSGGLTAAGSLVMKSVMLPSGQTAFNPRSRKTQMEHESIKEFPSMAEGTGGRVDPRPKADACQR